MEIEMARSEEAGVTHLLLVTLAYVVEDRAPVPALFGLGGS